METIFDYNPTKKEVKLVIGIEYTKEEYLKRNNGLTDVFIQDLVCLFNLRGDHAKEKEYVSLLSTEEQREHWLSVNHPIVYCY